LLEKVGPKSFYCAMTTHLGNWGKMSFHRGKSKNSNSPTRSPNLSSRTGGTGKAVSCSSNELLSVHPASTSAAAGKKHKQSNSSAGATESETASQGRAAQIRRICKAQSHILRRQLSRDSKPSCCCGSSCTSIFFNAVGDSRVNQLGLHFFGFGKARIAKDKSRCIANIGIVLTNCEL
jgi:hypothetical protein